MARTIQLIENIARLKGITMEEYEPFPVKSIRPPPSEIKPNMNKIVFLKNERFLFNWTEIVNIDHFLKQSGSSMSNGQIRFKIPYGYENTILAKDKKSGVSIILRSCAIIEGIMQPLQRDDYPIGLSLHLGTINCTGSLPREIAYSSSDEKKRVSIPTILNDCLPKDIICGKREAEFSMSFRTDDKYKKKKKYAMAVILAEKRSIDEVLNEIESRPKRSVDDFKTEILKFMNADEDILLEKSVVSLSSSITATRIKIPIRGVNCRHLLIDDLREYLQTNEETEKWECLICKKSMKPDDIFIDQYYSDLLSSNKTAMEVELYKDGKITVTKYQDNSSGEELISSDDEEANAYQKSLGIIPARDFSYLYNSVGVLPTIDSAVPQLPQSRTISRNSIATSTILKQESINDNASKRFTKKRPCSNDISFNGNEIECITILDSDDEGPPPAKKAAPPPNMMASMQLIVDNANFNGSSILPNPPIPKNNNLIGSTIISIPPIVESEAEIVSSTSVYPISPALSLELPTRPSIKNIIATLDSLNKDTLDTSNRILNLGLTDIIDDDLDFHKHNQNGTLNASYKERENSDALMDYYSSKNKADDSSNPSSNTYIGPVYETIKSTLQKLDNDPENTSKCFPNELDF
uniref:SP-RING-type domain-containing protein n=1 Tax=Rhabditophanes sp. KR3021 TaxID=114890 RepID=A0AC35U8T0_9BILA